MRPRDVFDHHPTGIDHRDDRGVGFDDAHRDVVVVRDLCQTGGQHFGGLELRHRDRVAVPPRRQRLEQTGRRLLGFDGPGHADRVDGVDHVGEDHVEQIVGLDGGVEVECAAVDGRTLARRALDQHPSHRAGRQRQADHEVHANAPDQV
nr:hypothetical protein [Mycobacterium sp. IDR2000157661]